MTSVQACEPLLIPGRPLLKWAGGKRQLLPALRARGVTLVHGSFDGALAEAGKGDFIYCDPPYAPVSRTACFANYTARGFTLNDQARLQHALVAAAERGASVVLSNSSAPDIEQLYSTIDARRAQLRIERVSARRAINSRADARGPVTELIVTNVAMRRSVHLDPARGNCPMKLRMARASLRRIRTSNG
jgi:site-specific DNA-adenine methylase